MHFPVSLLIVSPTAMGLMSGGQSSLFLFKAIKQPPAKNLDTDVGTFPAGRILTNCLREEQMDVGSGTLATSSRCWTRRPEGPAAVSLGKDHKLKSGSRVRGAEWDAGATGVGQLGCLDFNRYHVVSLFGAYRWTEGLCKLFQTYQICLMTQLGQ